MPDPATDPVTVVTAVFEELFQDCDRGAADRLLDPDYRHRMNGRVFDRDAIVHHVGVLDATYRSISILPFDEVVVDGANVAVRYTVHAQRPDGTLDRLSMAAFCTVVDGRLVSCDEVGHSIT